MDFWSAWSSASFLAMAFGGPFRGIAERVHNGDIQNYEIFKKRGRRASS